MIHKFREALDARKRTEAGLTLVELVVATGLLSMILGLFLLVFTLSIRSQGTVQSSVQDTGSNQVAMSVLARDIRTAQAVKPGGSIRLDLKLADGKCKAWFVSGGKLYQKTTTGAVGTSTVGAKLLINSVRVPPSTSTYFSTVDSTVTYAFRAGDDISRSDLIGSTSVRVPSTNTSPCF